MICLIAGKSKFQSSCMSQHRFHASQDEVLVMTTTGWRVDVSLPPCSVLKRAVLSKASKPHFQSNLALEMIFPLKVATDFTFLDLVRVCFVFPHHSVLLLQCHPPISRPSPPTDVNECVSYPPACSAHANCTNTRGSYSCSACSDGFTGDGYSGTNHTGCTGIEVDNGLNLYSVLSIL